MLNQIKQYIYLMRLHKPIGILLLLWPTLWALWLAGNGVPHPKVLMIFVLGVLIMRSAGCVINDYADRDFDRYVERTKNRPYASGKVTTLEVLVLASVLVLLAFLLVLMLNPLTIKLAFIGLILVLAYPFLKRITHLPQLGLSMAFSWGVPMAFAAQQNHVPKAAWVLFLSCLIWPLIYDTMYAMVDRKDDLKVGVKSTAILFNDMDTIIIALLQMLFIVMLVVVGLMFRLRFPYYLSLAFVSGLFIYQQYLIKDRNAKACFTAFQNNNWVGLVIFAGIVCSHLYYKAGLHLSHSIKAWL